MEHAEEVDNRVADWLFSSKVEAFEAGRFIGFNNGGVTASGTSPPLNASAVVSKPRPRPNEGAV